MDNKKIIDAIQSGVPGIHIQGQDYLRIDAEIAAIATQLNFQVKEWNLGYGWLNTDKQPLNEGKEVSLYDNLRLIRKSDPTHKLYVIKNPHAALNSDYRAIARLQAELLRIKEYFPGESAILLVDKKELSFPEISHLIAMIPCTPFSFEEAKAHLNQFIDKNSISIEPGTKNQLASMFSGMEREMITRILKMLNNRYQQDFPETSVNDALEVKKASLAKAGLLELVDNDISIDDIGGLSELKKWLRRKKYVIDHFEAAKVCGIAAPKGALLAGIPGCGKSMSAKAAASLFKVPLLRLDIGSLMGKFVGESEANMKAALHMAERASPCILWIDELEKAFSGINGSGGGAEVTTRLFGYFLTWLQEKPGSIFVIATANDITALPPELMRRGRFDEVFYINLPNQEELEQIFKVKIHALEQNESELDFVALAEKSDGFSGADIDCVINDSLEFTLRSGQETLTQDVIEMYIDATSPISDVLEEQIKEYQEKFDKLSFRNASISDDPQIDLDDILEILENKPTPKETIGLINRSWDAYPIILKHPNCPPEYLTLWVNNIGQYRRLDVFDKEEIGSVEKATILSLVMQHPNFGIAMQIEPPPLDSIDDPEESDYRYIKRNNLIRLYDKGYVTSAQLLPFAFFLPKNFQEAAFRTFSLYCCFSEYEEADNIRTFGRAGNGEYGSDSDKIWWRDAATGFNNDWWNDAEVIEIYCAPEDFLKKGDKIAIIGFASEEVDHYRETIAPVDATVSKVYVSEDETYEEPSFFSGAYQWKIVDLIGLKEDADA